MPPVVRLRVLRVPVQATLALQRQERLVHFAAPQVRLVVTRVQWQVPLAEQEPQAQRVSERQEQVRQPPPARVV